MAAEASGDDIKDRGQQSPLASRRGQVPANRGYFPLSYKEGLSQWWAGLSPVVTEHRVLSFNPYLQKPPTHTKTGSAPPSTTPSSMAIDDSASKEAEPVRTTSITDPYGPRKWHSNLVKLPGKDRALNEFSVERVGEDVDNNLVMLHGYGAGLGFFYKNFEALSRQQGWKLYALDMLGMGRSSRPPFRIRSKDRQEKITEAENWFIDALEDWRKEKKIDRFTLMGHSLGGYLAVAYALRYPGHLNKLILASPVGIPEDPYAVNADMPDPESSTMANEFTQTQDQTANSTNPSLPPGAKTQEVGDQNNFLNKGPKPASSDEGKNPPPRKPLPKLLTYMWDANISPFSLVRWSGPLGPRLVSGWTSRRFSFLPPEQSQALHDYSYSLFRQRGSGEYALAYILAPGAFARSPLIRRIAGVGRQYLGVEHAGPTLDGKPNGGGGGDDDGAKEKTREDGILVVLMYGENDWMDVKGGHAAKEKMDQMRDKILEGKSAEEKERDNGESKVVVVGKAGHHVYLDSWDEFNGVVQREMEDVERRERRRKGRREGEKGGT